MRGIFINQDLADAHYLDFLRRAAERYPYFSLIWPDGNVRPKPRWSPTAEAVREDLRPFLLEHRRTDRWPGTVMEMFNRKSSLFVYRTDPAAVPILERPGHLFGWVYWSPPSYPEDLAFYRPDGSCAVATIAHEEFAWFFDPDWFEALPSGANPTWDDISDADAWIFPGLPRRSFVLGRLRELAMSDSPQSVFAKALSVLERYRRAVVTGLAEEITEHEQDFDTPSLGRADEILDRYWNQLCHLEGLYDSLGAFLYDSGDSAKRQHEEEKPMRSESNNE